MTLYGGFVRVVIRWLPVRVVPFHEPRPPLRLTLRDGLLLMTSHLAVNLRVTILAYQDDVVHVEEQPLHLSLRLGRFEGDDMVAGKARLDITTIDTRLYAIALAHSAQSAVALPHESLDRWPSLIVKHLVMLRSESLPAHRPDGIL